MLRYINVMETFSEVPDMITLCINICDCPCHCHNCHSPFLWDNWEWNEESIKKYGKPKFLSLEVIDSLVKKHKGIDCIALMGGDINPKEVNKIAKYIRSTFDNINIAWYSGNSKLSDEIDLTNFDYIKLGPYIKENGGLNNPNTNQKFYEVCRLSKLPDKFLLKDITNKFWK